ncbi:vitamin K epoxide reductase family protein [Candidatus Uhrbacteria bacterium]|nr:vitamin K epoxide reductase family protein [Candidatus Uhrbacteria bacterium]
MPLPSILFIFLGFAGFLLSFYIWHKKQAHEKMACPLHSNCDTVIHSAFARFFGIPVELLGMGYYGAIAVAYGAVLAAPSLAVPELRFLLMTLSTTAFLFSLYLTFIQLIPLRQWCTWCLTSAGLSTLIFAITVTTTELTITPLLVAYHRPIVMLHVFGVALGLGGATISDIFFFRFLKDFRISEFEADVLRTLSQVIWLALAIIVLSGIGLYLPESARLLQASKFIVKMIIVVVLTVNGAALGLYLAPKLVTISFGGKHAHESGELRRLRKIAFALGAVSIVSWYSAFILGGLRTVPLSIPVLLALYIGILGAAIVGSQIMERMFRQRAHESG